MIKSARQHLLSLLFLITVVLSIFSVYGCGSTTKNRVESIRTVSGKIIIPADGFDLKSVSVWIEQAPMQTTICDSEGNFTLEIPFALDDFNIVASLGNINSGDFYIQKSAVVNLEGSSHKILSPLTLEKGDNRIEITVKDFYGNAIRYAPCEVWGKTFQTDYYGKALSPALPASVSDAVVNVNAFGFVSFSARLPFFSSDLGPCLEINLAKTNDGRSSPVVYFDKTNLLVNTDSTTNLSVQVLDLSNLLPAGYLVDWSCTEGSFTVFSNSNKNAVWLSPSVAGIATITASISTSSFTSKVSMGFEVGGSRKVNTKILSFSPTSAAAGETVTITGFGFETYAGGWQIDFSGALGEVISQNDTEIKVRVPRDAETGPLKLINAGRTIICDVFTAIDYQASVFPTYGAPGAAIKVKGYGFGELGTNTLLLYGETVHNITKWTNTEIEFVVENSAHSGPIEVVIRGRSRPAGDFTVSAIKNMTPDTTTRYVLSELPFSRESSGIIITGSGFGESESSDAGESSVKFRTYDDTGSSTYIVGEVVSWSESEIEVNLPIKAYTGQVVLCINGTDILGPTLNVEAPKNYRTNTAWGDQLLDSHPIISGCAPTPDDGIILADSSNYRLWFFDESGDYVKYVNLADASALRMPYGICTDSSGNIFISDITNSCILKLDSTGAVLKISTYNFGNPLGLCVDSTGKIYVADSSKHKIVILNKELDFVGEFGSKGNGSGQFNEPMGVGLSADESKIYIADSANHRIVCYDFISSDAGTAEVEFSSWLGYDGTDFGWHSEGYGYSGSSSERFNSPTAVINSNGYLYVADTGNNVVKKISESADSVFVIGTEGSGNGQFYGPSSVFASGSNLYISDSENSRVQVISTGGAFIKIIEPNTSGMNVSFLGIAVSDAEEMLYVLDSGDCSISVFDFYGNFEKKFASMGSGNGQLQNPSGIALDSEGNIFVADTGNARIAKFSQDGTFSSFGEYGTGAGQFRSPQRIIIDKSDRIYVSDFENNRINVYSSEFLFEATFGESIMNGPMGIAIASDSSVYVADSGNHRVCKFDKDFGFLGWLGTSDGVNGGWHTSLSGGASGSNPCQFNLPADLAIDFEGSLYVIDYANYSLQKFGEQNTADHGNYLNTIAFTGDDFIYGIAIDKGGCLFTTHNDDLIRKLVPYE
ncbi:MAG: 6-bladed beta-propeller [Candidatus Riflebacteria bacterium]|nr:6-bladed beta-propeller [Candidatus Riflebacteria bacterium]